MIETERLISRQYSPDDTMRSRLASDASIRQFVDNMPETEEAAWSRVLAAQAT